MGSTGTPTLVREEAERDPRLAVVTDRYASERRNERIAELKDRRSFGRRMLNEGALVYLFALAVYLTVAVLLDLKYHSFSDGDATSRMANAFYILYSRDPHLAAVGFVWTPLQSIADMVFLLGNHLWPALSHDDMAGSLVSALAMAGAVYQIRSTLRDWGVTRVPCLVLTALFALNPMILLYGGNGMSEGLFLFTLTASTRYLSRWIRGGDLRSLAYSGVWLGFGYLTRNEAALAAVAAAFVVAVVSFARADGERSARFRTALSDAAILAAPPFVAAAGWAITSYVIVGQYFAQFQSIYGNSSQERYLSHFSLHGRVVYELQALGSLAPLLVVVLIASVIVALKRRDPRILAPLAVLGGALGFDVLAYLNNNIENFFRYYIVSIPLEVLLAGLLMSAVQAVPRGEKPPAIRSPRSAVRVLTTLVAVSISLLIMLPATVTTGAAMFNPKIGSEQLDSLGYIFHSHLTANDQIWKSRYPHILAIGNYIAGLHLPEGDIVVDNFDVCLPQLLTTISTPKVFVIPNDRDFQRVLSDPITFNAHYILETDPTQFPTTSINIQYPKLWSSGSEFTKMVHQFPARASCPAYRLFRVLGHSTKVT